MKNNIISKKLCKKALIAFLCYCLLSLSLLMFSCTPLDSASSDPGTDTNTNDATESGKNSTVDEQTTAEEEISTEEETTEEETEEQAEAVEITINVYYSDQMAEYLIPESRIILSQNKYVDALYELMKKPIDSSLTPLVPDTTIINSVTIEEGNAKVDLSQEFLDDRYVSDTVDILLIQSIVHTLTQFQGVNSVTLYIDGVKLDTLGQLDIMDPVFKKNDLIKDN